VRTRIGIELTAVACRVVEVADRRWVGRGPADDSVVRSFGVWPALGADAGAVLAPLRGKAASVVVWGAPSEHHQVDVTLGSYEAMRGEALRMLDGAGVSTRGAWADIAPAGPANRGRRPVIVTAASASAIAAAVQPLVDAGIRVRAAITPAAALAGIARSRRTNSVPDAIEAYVALEETATCVALIRGGVLMAARDLPWGFLEECGNGTEPRPREDIAARLGDDLADFFSAYEDAGRVGQLCICGGLPELRSTTLPLMERFDVEVETLDSLFRIDPGSLPEPADEFRERAPELRLAWAAAADWATINLLRAQRRRRSSAVLSHAAVVAGVVFGFGGAWSIVQSEPQGSPAPAHLALKVSQVVPTSPPPIAQEPPEDTAASPPIVQEPPSIAAEPAWKHEPTPIKEEPTLATVEPIKHEPAPIKPETALSKREPAAISRVPAAVAAERPPVHQEPPAVARILPPAIAAPPPIRSEPPAIRQEPVVVRPDHVARAAVASGARPRVEEQALPFEAVLTGILFSPDRQLAIIDGRVVGRGDDVRGAIVVDVTATAVLLRDSQGRLRRLSSSGSGR
jgi:hypothetical protein